MDDDQHSALSDTTCTTKKTDDKPSHDASIFVGSLPSNVDQGDLSRMLMDHLSEHTQIKNVKVVRDSRGGVCAFVQCLDASSATSIIETLYSNPPKPFLGRILRYEPARAFRTLIISYRAPIHLCPANYSSGSFKDPSTEMELPTAMRIWKNPNSRFHSIFYNGQALKAEENQGRSVSSESEDVFFLHPVRYDEETLRDLAAYFGLLESFHAIEVPADSQYLTPHNGPRSSTMDSRCWEVKWQHRDECVSALMALRRVPHLTVTWAHQHLPRSPVFQRQPHYDSGTPSVPFRFQHERSEPHEFLSQDIAHPTGSRRYDRINCQFVRQKYGPQVAMGRGIVHSSRALANKQSLRENPNTIGSEYSFQHRQNPVSPSFETAALSKESETQDHAPPCPADLDAQDVSVPQTPDSSSITSATSGTSYDNFGMKEANVPEYGGEKQVDPTTLFVGGLEVAGPGAWDEEKVRIVFSRYGGLESIKFVRPINATVAFAFIKFDNIEAPARAVQEEHNRVYEGRALRVQLRDINPPKGNWKFGRGRGRFLQHNFNPNGRYNYRPFINRQDNPTVATDCSLETDNSQSSLSGTWHQHGESSTTEVCKEAPGTDKFREWYDDLESPHTPAPSSKGSSASITCASHTNPSYPVMHSGPYMPPAPWMQPYVPNGSYPLPYYPGYAFYPPPTIPQQPFPMIASPSADANGSSVGSLPVWPSGVYGSFVSYPIGPMRVPTVGQASQSQPPLTPSGFIQNEHGTLIAVYQEEALSRYMAGSGEPSNAVHPEASPYYPDGTQPSNYVSHRAGPMSVNAAPFHRHPGVQIQGTQPMNAPFDIHHRPPKNHDYNNIGRNNLQPGTFPRSYAGRSGREYVQKTPTPHHGRGGQAGRTFGNWN